MNIIQPSVSDKVEIISQDIVYKGYVQIAKIRLRHHLFKGGWSSVLTRDLAIRGRAVAVLLYDPTLDAVVMIEQFRIGAIKAATDPWLIEVVAGMVEDSDEHVEAVARRETVEETGLEILDLIPIHQYWISPGASTGRMDLYCGRVDASKADGIHGATDEGEDIRVIVYTAKAAFAALEENRFDNATAIIALQWLQLNHQRLRQQWSHS